MPRYLHFPSPVRAAGSSGDLPTGDSPRNKEMRGISQALCKQGRSAREGPAYRHPQRLD